MHKVDMMSIEPFFNVVIPAYNAEKHIEHSIKSILDNSFKDFEIIIVDDGSTDNTRIICESLCELDNRLRYIHQQNSGPNTARNNAIEYAKGKYILFLDADDELLENAMEVLYKELTFEYFDFINYGISFVNKKTNSITNKITHERRTLKDDEILKASMSGNGILSVCWSKAISREFLIKNNIRFISDKVHGRDIIFSKLLSFKSKKSLVIPDTLVRSYEINDSFSRTFSMKNINSAIQVSNDLIEIFSDKNIDKDMLNYSIYKHLRYITVVGSFRFDEFTSYKLAINTVEKSFPNTTYFKNCKRLKDYLLVMWLKLPIVSFAVAKLLKRINIRPY